MNESLPPVSVAAPRACPKHGPIVGDNAVERAGEKTDRCYGCIIDWQRQNRDLKKRVANLKELPPDMYLNWGLQEWDPHVFEIWDDRITDIQQTIGQLALKIYKAKKRGQTQNVGKDQDDIRILMERRDTHLDLLEQDWERFEKEKDRLEPIYDLLEAKILEGIKNYKQTGQALDQKDLQDFIGSGQWLYLTRELFARTGLPIEFAGPDPSLRRFWHPQITEPRAYLETLNWREIRKQCEEYRGKQGTRGFVLRESLVTMACDIADRKEREEEEAAEEPPEGRS